MKTGFFTRNKLVGGRWIPNSSSVIGKDMKNQVKRRTMLDLIKGREKK